MVNKGALSKEEALAEYARLTPIMAIEGRTMSEPTQELLVELLQNNITLEDALDSIINRRTQPES
ncbi:hypothetical protein D6M20_02590 (plasmid) [Rhodococcus qingshengii]|uniref:Antitoxin VbhA domain-containing protein n=1 Tax=Rhodococcus erythropolis TaxID=1833 RepID=A0A8I1D931_RHOER|nr:hypothetical protein [Rhodococcus erythropolis]QEM25744.1 hypothetical protein D6M20_02590 [Rhodococcus qingshengii]